MAVELIGRREELLAFDRFLEAVPAGGQALLLEGDAGIGKTALWQEGNRLARERGFRVLTSRSAHSETQIAFATVGDVFAPVVKETTDSPIRRQVSAGGPPRRPRPSTVPLDRGGSGHVDVRWSSSTPWAVSDEKVGIFPPEDVP